MPTYFEVQLPTATTGAFNKLKADLLVEGRASGDDPPLLTFDDGARSIAIGYQFKQFMDRFPTGVRAIRKALGLEADPRPFQDIFRDVLATPTVRQRYTDKEDEVLDDLRGQPYAEPAQPLATGPQGATAKAAAVAAMQAQPGMCLDDNHAQGATKDLLIDGMDDLAAQGVTTLFVEHFWQEQQALLDQYLTAPADAPLPPALAEAVRKLDEAPGLNGGQHFERLLAAAKRARVRVVGLDDFDAKTPQDNDPRNWERRAARFNKTAADVVKREKGAGKFLLMAGAKHNNTHEGGIPGLAQLLGVHTVEVAADGKLKPHAEDKALRGMRSEAEQAFLDAYVDRFKARKGALLVAQPPAGNIEKQQAALRAACIMRAAADTARTMGQGLERLAPAKIAQIASEAADRAIVEIDAGRATVTSAGGAGPLVKAGTAKDDAYATTLRELTAAARQGPTGGARFKAALAGADPRMLTEGFTFKQGSIEVEGASALHIAAMCGDDALVDTLLTGGMNVGARDAGGNTPLHAVGFAAAATDNAQVVRKLVAGGASLLDTNKKGQTPVHLAAFGGKAQCLGELATSASFAQANVADRRGWTPADMAVAAGQGAAENWFYANHHATADSLLTAGEEQTGLSTIEILVKATKVEGPVDADGNPTETAAATTQKVRDHYTELYRQPELRSVMDMAAADALGKRSDARKALRMFMTFNSDFAGTLTGKGGKGAFDDRSNTLVLAARRPPKELRGTAIHEMTHHAADMAFGNAAIPYDDEAGAEATAYRNAIEADYPIGSAFLAGPEKDIAYVIGGRMNEYRRANVGDKRKPMLQEYVVGVPQVIAEHGIEYARKVAPNLTDFFANELTAKCTQTLAAHAKFTNVQRNAAIVGGLAPVPPVDTTAKTWVKLQVGPGDKDPVNLVEPGKQTRELFFGDAAKAVLVATAGTKMAAYPNSPAYANVQGQPVVLDWSDPQVASQAVDTLNAENFTNLFQRRFRQIARDLPAEVDIALIQRLASEAVQGVPANPSKQDVEQLLDTCAEKVRGGVREARLAYLQRAKDTHQLTKDLVARTIVYEAACKALESDHRRDNRVKGEGPDLNDEKVAKLVAGMVAKMTDDQMDKLASDPQKVQDFATALTGSETSGKVIKTTVLHGFYTKKTKPAGASHVSLKVSQAKKEWVKKLATL